MTDKDVLSHLPPEEIECYTRQQANVVFRILSRVIERNKWIIDASSFGLSPKTFINWRDTLRPRSENWLPSSAVLERIVLSPGFKRLDEFERWVFLRFWIIVSLRSARKGKAASTTFVHTIEAMFDMIPMKRWENFPSKFLDKVDDDD